MVGGYSQLKEVYTPQGFILHAASPRQPFGHCEGSLTAASRRSRVRISIPLLAVGLSPRLPVIALVGYYLTN